MDYSKWWNLQFPVYILTFPSPQYTAEAPPKTKRKRSNRSKTRSLMPLRGDHKNSDGKIFQETKGRKLSFERRSSNQRSVVRGEELDITSRRMNYVIPNYHNKTCRKWLLHTYLFIKFNFIRYSIKILRLTTPFISRCRIVCVYTI